MSITLSEALELQARVDEQGIEIDRLQYLVALLRQEKEEIADLKNRERQTAWRLRNVEWERDALKAKLHAAEAELELVQEERDELKADYHQPQLCAEHMDSLEQDAEIALKTLLAVGLHPLYHTGIVEASRGAEDIIRVLRRELSDPPADVQERVLRILKVKGYCEEPEYKLKKIKKDARNKP